MTAHSKTLRTLILLLLALALPIAALYCLPWRPTAASLPGPDQWFAENYDLEPAELVRFIPPPYPPLRSVRYGRGSARPGKYVSGYMLFHAGKPDRFWGMSSASGTLYDAITWCGPLTRAELDIPDQLAQIPVDGDWTIRVEAPRDDRLKALQDILRQALRRSITIEKRFVPATVLVARGSYAFQSLNQGRSPNTVQLFTDTLDPEEGAGGGTGPLKNLFDRIENIAALRLINEVQHAPDRLSWSNNRSAHNARQDPAKLDLLIENVFKQTALRLSRETRNVDVYFVREQSPATNPSTQPKP